MPRPLHAITLGEMLAHDSEEVRRHAQGAMKALTRDIKRLTAQQDKDMTIRVYVRGGVAYAVEGVPDGHTYEIIDED